MGEGKKRQNKEKVTEANCDQRKGKKESFWTSGGGNKRKSPKRSHSKRTPERGRITLHKVKRVDRGNGEKNLCEGGKEPSSKGDVRHAKMFSI